MEEIRNVEEIRAKIAELEKQLEYRYTASTKELIETKIATLRWALKEIERL